MPKTAEELQNIIDENSNMPVHMKNELTYRHMLLLAECYENWTNADNRIDEEGAAQLIGYAQGLKSLASLVGPDWSPPEPEHLCLTAFLARDLERQSGQTIQPAHQNV